MELSRQYAQLADDTKYAVALAPSEEVGRRVKFAVQELGNASIDLVKRAGACRSAPDDQIIKRDVAESARNTCDKVCDGSVYGQSSTLTFNSRKHQRSMQVTSVLGALHSGSRGTQACINAASTVSGIIGDLDTTILFATAGSLNPDSPAEHFGDHSEAILRTAKALVEDTKALVAGAASSQVVLCFCG